MKFMTAIDEERPLLKTLSEEAQSQSYQTAHVISTPSPDVQKPSSTSSSWRGHVLLVIVAVLYGTLNVCLRAVYGTDDPPTASALSTVRGWLGVLCFVPFLQHPVSYVTKSKSPPEDATHTSDNSNAMTTNSNKTTNTSLTWIALELAIWNFGAQGLANMGLLYIAAARAAFFTQLSVVLTPLLSAALGAPRPHAAVWWACALALVGLLLLSQDHDGSDTNDDDTTDDDASSSSSSHGLGLGVGDLMCLGGALSWSTYLYRLSAVGSQYPEVELQALKTFFLAILYTLWCIASVYTTGQAPWMGWNQSWTAWMILLYSAAGPGTVADLLQQQGQAVVSATVANIVLSLEPVFTALFGRLLLGEETSWVEKMGGLCILTAAMVATR